MRNKVVRVRLSAEEFERFCRRAARRGYRPAVYLRRLALGARDRSLSVPAVNVATVGQLRRIGNNINQLTALAHTGRISPLLGQTLVALAQLLRSFHRALIGLLSDPP